MFDSPGSQAPPDPVFGRPGSFYPGPAWTPELARAAQWQPPPADSSPPAEDDDRIAAAQQEVMALASMKAAVDGRLVEVLAEHGEALSGPDDLARWLSWAAGMKPSVAKSFLRLANKSEEVPQISAALSGGEISFDKATTIARVATSETEQALVEWAKNGTVSQLSSITSGYLKVKAADEQDGAHLRRNLSYFFSEDGTFRLRAQMSADEGAVVARAIDAASEKLFEEQKSFKDHELDDHGAQDQRSAASDHRGARQADALLSLAETFLEEGLVDSPRSERYKVLVHVDAATLAGESGGFAELEDGVGISHETALRLACDCKIQALVNGKEVPLKLGREQRLPSPALRRALRARDRHCTFPGCTSRRRLQAHHVKHWVKDQGETEPENLSLLCPRHHRLVHEGHYTMTFDGSSAPRFFRPDGSEVERVPKWPELTEVERYEWCARDDLDYDAWAHWIDDFDLNEAVAYLLREDRDRHPPLDPPPPDPPPGGPASRSRDPDGPSGEPDPPTHHRAAPQPA